MKIELRMNELEKQVLMAGLKIWRECLEEHAAIESGEARTNLEWSLEKCEAAIKALEERSILKCRFETKGGIVRIAVDKCVLDALEDVADTASDRRQERLTVKEEKDNEIQFSISRRIIGDLEVILGTGKS